MNRVIPSLKQFVLAGSVALIFVSSTVCSTEPAPITALAISPDGKLIVTGSQDGVRVLSWPALTPMRTISTELRHVHDILLLPHKMILAGGSPAESGEIEILEWPDGKRLLHFADGNDVFYSVAARDGVLAVGSGDHRIRLVDETTGAVRTTLNRHSRRVLDIEFLKTAKATYLLSASADHTIRLWQGSVLIRSLDNHTDVVRDIAVHSASDSDNSRPLVASAGADSTVRFWQPTIGRLVRFTKLPSEPLALAWLPGGRYVVASCIDGKARAIDSITLTIIESEDSIEGWAHAIASHPTKPQVAIGGQLGQIKLVRFALRSEGVDK